MKSAGESNPLVPSALDEAMWRSKAEPAPTACAMPLALRGEWEKLGTVVQANQVVAVLIMTAAFFLLNRVCFLLFGFMKDTKRRDMLGSCICSVVHCTVVTVLTYEELCGRDWTLLGFYSGGNGAKFDLGSPNSATGTAAIIYCTGFMLADQIFMYIWCPWEKLFILHHWATLLYMGAVLWLGTGDLSCCLCICLGEVTNPINNTMAISDLLHSEGLLPPVVNRLSAAALCVAFVFIRVLYAPFGVCYVICHYYLVSGAGGHVNLAVRLLWCILPVAVTYVSIDYLRNLVNDVIHDTVNSVARKARDEATNKKQM